MLSGKQVIVFDGECVLCEGFFNFILARDHNEIFQFATAQSPIGRALYRALNQDPENPETMITANNDMLHQHADAVGFAVSLLGGVWSFARFIKYVPIFIKTPAYRFFAKRRFQIWGRRESCMIAPPEMTARFITDYK